MRRLISSVRGTASALLVAALFAPVPLAGQGAPPEAGEPAVLFLVRHAETAPDGTRNPPLSPEGLERAWRLAALIEDAELDAVYTTDYARTRSTAAAVAEPAGLEVQVYDPRDLAAFASSLATRGGRMLVVGHSNTTPALVEALGGDPGEPIDHAEHDRLYVVFTHGQTVRTVLLRY